MNTHAAGLTTEALLAEAQWVRGLALHLTRDPDPLRLTLACAGQPPFELNLTRVPAPKP